jgi:hypothetical protein
MKPLITFFSLVIFLSMGFQVGAQSIINYAFTPTSGPSAAQDNFPVSMDDPPPDCAVIGLPADGSTDVALTSVLTWTAGSTGGIPTGYYLYFGTDGGGITPPTNFVNGTVQTSPYDPGLLLIGQTFYWQVVPFNDSGSATGCDIWSFTTVPSCPGPTILNSTDITTTSAVLHWTYGTTPDSFFDVFWGPEGFDPDVSGTLITGVNSGYTLDPPLQSGTAYNWYVRANCGEFYAPDVDYFYMAMDGGGNLLPFPISGGTDDDPGETGIWQYYDQAPGDMDWWNIWFYNAPPDTNRMKKIRMGFWIQSYDGSGQGLVSYVVNWSDSTWLGSGFPSPIDENHIRRSPVNGPEVVLPGPAQWIEINFEIPTFNPEWVSVDIFGENIQILEVSNEPPPTGSPLLAYWQAGMPGGIIVHECLPKPYGNVSPWIGPSSFTTPCLSIADLPVSEGFEDTWPPECWDDPVPDDFGWDQSINGGAHTGFEWAYCNLANSTLNAPSISLVTDSRLKFWYRAESSGYPQDMAVKVGNTVIHQIIGATNTTYQEVALSLAAFTGSTIAVTFTGETGTGGFDTGICIDDVSIETIPFIWTGAVDTDWANIGNWDRGSLPGQYDRVIIPTTANIPIIGNNSTVNVYDVTLQTGASIAVQNGSSLNVLKTNP